MMVTEYIIKKALDLTLKASAKFLKEKSLKLTSSSNDIEQSLSNHITQITNWSTEISFSDLKRAKNTSDVFIDIDIFLMPLRKRMDMDENIEKIGCRDLFKVVANHCIILGQPGAGKTTLMKFICQLILFDEKFYATKLKIPLLIRLRDLNTFTGESSVIINYLFDIVGLVLDKEKKDDKLNEEDIELAKKRLLIPLLEDLQPLIILDGFDELSTQKLKDKVFQEFKELVFSIKSGRIILTSRSSDFSYRIENASALEIAPLNPQQTNLFAKKWLIDKEKVEDFLDELRKSPFVDTTIRPLTLSHLCAIYERSGKIPEKPKTVYKKIVNLLLEEWDEQREVRRLTQYGNFEIDRKFEFLCRLAFEITLNYKDTVFTENQLTRIYHNIHINFGLPKNEANKVVKELEGHTGLILQSGFDNFEFAHKSIHEYLCAEHLVKLPTIPKNLSQLSILPNELAIATTISSDPSEYFVEFIFNRLADQRFSKTQSKFSNHFIATFVNRLVIEKPEFNSSKNISLALVILYTFLRQGDFGQLQLFDTDLPIQFEEFVEMVFKRNTKFEFTKFYELEKELNSEDSQKIIQLKRRKSSYSYNNLGFVLPPILYAKKSFVVGY